MPRDTAIRSPSRPARARAEALFTRWGRFVVRHAAGAVGISLVLTAGLAAQLPDMRVDLSDRAFFHPDDPALRTHDRFTEHFGAGQFLLIAIRPPEIFERSFLEWLRAFHRDLERSVPQLSEVRSLVNARHTYGRDDELVVEPLLGRLPERALELAALRSRVLSDPLYRNLFISDDGRTTAVMLELDPYALSEGAELAPEDVLDGAAFSAHEGTLQKVITTQDKLEIVGTVRDVMERHSGPGHELYLTGLPTLEATLMTSMQRDLALFIALSVALIALLLFVLFRCPAGVALPLLVVALSLTCAMGAMAAAGVPLTLPIQVLPSFLLTVGVCDSIHLLVHFFKAREGRPRREAVVAAVAQAGLPIVLTTLTTAGALASFVGAELAPVSHFGVFGPLGVLLALKFTLVLLPALLAVVPEWTLPRRRAATPGALVAVPALNRLGAVALRRPRAVVGAAAVLAFVALAGAAQLGFSFAPLEWLPEDEPVRVATRFVDRELGGSWHLETLIETGVEGGLYDPDLLQRIDTLGTRIGSYEAAGMRVGKTLSIADIVKEINQAVHDNDPEHYAIPGDRSLVAQEVLLFENAAKEDLEHFLGSRAGAARFQIRVPQGDAVQGMAFIEDMEAEFQEALSGRAEVSMTGSVVMNGRAYVAIIHSMAESYGYAFLIVTPLMILFLGSFRAGLISLVPNLLPILLTLGLMGWLGFSLDFTTMMIGAVVLGLAVDDTIHFMNRFLSVYERDGDVPAAVFATLDTTGSALLVTSIVLIGGFLIYTGSSMSNLVHLGLFSSFAIFCALLADLLVLPSLLTLLRRHLNVVPVEASGTRGREATAGPSRKTKPFGADRRFRPR